MQEYKKISIIIPVYNERGTIQSVIDLVNKATTAHLEKEIILIDDNSNDGTIEVIKKVNQSNLKVILHEQNKGKGGALHSGFKEATGDIIVIQDADLEYNPRDIEKIIQPFIYQNAKVVYGSRYLDPSRGLIFWHSFLNRVFTEFANIFTGLKLTDIMTCYKAFNKEVLGSIINSLKSKRFGFEPEVTVRIGKAGYKIVEVPVSYRPRSRKEGKHMSLKGELECLWTIIRYSLFK